MAFLNILDGCALLQQGGFWLEKMPLAYSTTLGVLFVDFRARELLSFWRPAV